MARIYNSDLHKEVQEGGRLQIIDRAPIELADKIVPVMEVNPKLLRRINIMEGVSNTGTATIYTTPTDRDFYLSAVTLSCTSSAAGVNVGTITAIIKGKGSTAVNVTQVVLSNSVAIDCASGVSNLNFEIPILLERNTAIATGAAGTLTGKRATIFGYVVDNSKA